ncbi:hypothetical protein DM01DRAFT_1115577 [Hesseltinella vesiculosa]|uniref:RecA family profile 1 domain-containing protein n=1 Tax=Hesseltinella vesiculosa TaxID=101127 RepID=A0A1X2G9E3_9FUNG|nr:hypothetical protein DM01DRAFT_1115577 [Hesseltinella vesiculosa]
MELAKWFGTLYDSQEQLMTARIHTMRIHGADQLFRTIAYQLPVLLQQRDRIRLVVIDSLAAGYRGVKQFSDLSELSEVGLRLKRLACQYQVAIVVVNQVMDTVADDLPSTSSRQGGSHLPEHVHEWLDVELHGTSMTYFLQSLAKQPTLGLTWANAVTTRLRMARSPMMDGQMTKRALFVEFSPLAPRSGTLLLIDATGTHAI